MAGRVTAVLAAAAAPPAAPPSLSATFSAPFVRLGPEEKTARRRRREVLDVLRRRRGAPASAKVRRRDASRSARTHAAVSSAVGRFGRQVTSFASASAAAGVPNARTPRLRLGASPPSRRRRARRERLPGGGRRPATSGTSASGTRARRLARPRRARAAAGSTRCARSNATHLCERRRRSAPPARASSPTAEAAPRSWTRPAPRRPPRAATGRDPLSPSLSRAAKSAACLLHEPPGRGRRRAERQARRGDGETPLRASSAGALGALYDKPAAKRSSFRSGAPQSFASSSR